MYPKDKMNCKKCEIDFNNHGLWQCSYCSESVVWELFDKEMNSYIGVTDKYNA